MSDERFASWETLVAYIQDRYPAGGASGAVADGATALVPAASGRAVTITVRPLEVVGRPWVELTARIGPSQRIPPGTILARSLGVIVGACYLDGTTLWLRQTLPLGLRRDDLEDALRAFAAVADDGAESNRIREDKGLRGRATPWTDWPSDEPEA